MKTKSSDPTKDPEFQRVVQTFLHTKPKPQKAGKKKRAISKKRRAKAKAETD
jgi:hypothetical protein